MFKKILCPIDFSTGAEYALHVAVRPIDFSDGSRHALELAADLAAPGGAGIVLLHAIEIPVVYSGEMLPPDLFAEPCGRR